MTSPDVYSHVSHRAFDIESAGARADRHVLARISGDGALAALVVDRDLAHGGARADLHAGLFVEADADRTHLAAHLARAGVDAAARGHAAGLRYDVDGTAEIVDAAAAGLHLGRDGPMHTIDAQAARLHADGQGQVRVHSDLQAAAGLEVETVDLDAPPGHTEGPGVLLLEGHVLDHHGVAVDAHAVGAFGDGGGHGAVRHDLGTAELGENLDRGGLRRGRSGGECRSLPRGRHGDFLGRQLVQPGSSLLGGDASGTDLVE